MAALSKSKLMAYRVCPKQLWLEVHRRELRENSPGSKQRMETGHMVGRIAQELYDSKDKGEEIKPFESGFDAAYARTAELLEQSRPIFEASFTSGGALAFADVLLPVRKGGKQGWRMVEVKSSASVKDYHRDDAAVQAYVARSSGVPLVSVSLAHIDSTWVYPGNGDYQGLLVEHDLTEEAFDREDEVKTWISEAQKIAAKRKEPQRRTGKHCTSPYECGYLAYCQSQEPQAEYPVHWLPRVQSKALKSHIEDGSVIDMRDVPDELLNELQQRVKKHTISGRRYFDAPNAARALAMHKLPAYFLDFETIQFAIPIWKGTSPYQQLPFQFSLHRLGRTGKLISKSFLDLSGNDPSLDFAQALIAACDESGPVFVYNEGFEKARIGELAKRFPKFKGQLLAINERIVDLLPTARNHYYHPKQQGSWSIKKVLPSVAPDLRYDKLDGVQDGGMAMEAFVEAIDTATTSSRKDQIEKQLLQYCGLDTYAMVRLWKFFAGRHDLEV
jgi:CRISPR/Cas system-associated exonuclease Cas4 (RecB family)